MPNRRQYLAIECSAIDEAKLAGFDLLQGEGCTVDETRHTTCRAGISILRRHVGNRRTNLHMM